MRPRPTASSPEWVRNKFEAAYLQTSPEQQLLLCEQSQLADTFRKWLPDNQPVLEAGSGSGRWVTWFLNNGWQAYGIDWSHSLCARADQAVDGLRFACGDLRTLPFSNDSFGAVVALGSIEHVAEGPQQILDEFFRVLAPGGIVLATVPFNSLFRRIVRGMNAPWTKLKTVNLVRRLFGKSVYSGITVKQAAERVVPEWMTDFHHSEAGWYFYQYHFTRAQMRMFLRHSGFDVLRQEPIMADSGIYNTLGGFGGRYDSDGGQVSLNLTGKVLKKILGVKNAGHMLLSLAQKKI